MRRELCHFPWQRAGEGRVMGDDAGRVIRSEAFYGK
jgi:hypothetical protein